MYIFHTDTHRHTHTAAAVAACFHEMRDANSQRRRQPDEDSQTKTARPRQPDQDSISKPLLIPGPEP